jgi:hypothetical protein
MIEENSVFIVPCIHNSDINEKNTLLLIDRYGLSLDTLYFAADLLSVIKATYC